jgi:hypothetical protein
MSNVPDLQPIAADTSTLLKSRPNTKCQLQLQRPVCSAVWTYDVLTSYRYQLNAKCQDFITRYLERSLVSPDDPSWIHVNRKLLHLAFIVSNTNLILALEVLTISVSISILLIIRRVESILDARLSCGCFHI